MKKSIMVIALLMALLLVITGCVTEGGPEQEQNAAADPAKVQSEESSSTGGDQGSTPGRSEINLATNAAMTTTDGHASNNLQDKYVFMQMYEGLYYFNEAEGKLEPRVAESYVLSEDGKKYTFTLRKDAYFHNGDPVKASDVAFSFLRAMESAGVSSFASNIVDAKAVDDNTVEIYLETSYAPFMVNMCNIFVMSEKEVTSQGEAFGTAMHLAGCGPYYMTSYSHDTKWVLEAFPQYYRGEANIKKINYTPIADASAGLIALEAGELDWYTVGTTDYAVLSANDKFKSELMAANHTIFLAVNYEANDVLANDLVRQAIGYAIDKDAMNFAAFDGLATEAKYLENPDYNIGAPVSDVMYDYNPEKAKALLAEAGYPNGCNIGSIMGFTGNFYEKCVQVLQANLADVGITADIEWAEQASSLARGRVQDYDIYVSGASSYGDYDNIRRRFYSSMEGAYFVKYKGDKFDWQKLDELMDASCAATDINERLKISAELNDMLMETATYFPLIHRVQPYVWSADLNVVNQPNYYCVYEWSFA